MSQKRKYRTFTPEQKTEIVLAGLRGDRSVRDVCREYEVSEALDTLGEHPNWRPQPDQPQQDQLRKIEYTTSRDLTVV